MSFDRLLARSPDEDQLAVLGAECNGGRIRVPSFGKQLLIDPDVRNVVVEGGGEAQDFWALLTLHYLVPAGLDFDAREVSLRHFPDCLGYLPAFEQQVLARFLATVGRSADTFIAASERAGGIRQPGSGVRFEFSVLPRVPLVIVRHDGDDEFDAAANVLYRADARHLLAAEDRIVAAELVFAMLTGNSLEAEA